MTKFLLDKPPLMIFQGKKRVEVTLLFDADFNPEISFLVLEVSSFSLQSFFL